MKCIQISVKLPSGTHLHGRMMEHSDELATQVKEFLQQVLLRGGLTLEFDGGMFLIPERLLQRSYITVLIGEEDNNVGS